MTDDTLIVVTNRDNGKTGYNLDNNFFRGFEVGETKKIPFSELKALSYKIGGQVLLRECLIIEDKEALEALNMNVEPEYFYTEEDIRKLLFDVNNIDAFMDFIDFAPKGAIDIAKDIAIKEQIPDVRKRDAISKKTGLNINNAIMVNEIMNAEDDNAGAEAPKQRRVQVTEENTAVEESPSRRTSTPSYKVVKK